MNVEEAKVTATPASPPREDEASRSRGLFSALRIMSAGSLLAIVFGVGTNKIIALSTGPDGIALIGLYRTVGSMTTAMLMLGMSEVIVRRGSLARTRGDALTLVRSTLRLLVMQLAVLGLLVVVAAPWVARLIFGRGALPIDIRDVRLVIGMCLGTLLMSGAIALLNGQLRMKDTMRVTLFTSVMTLATTYPLLLLGRVGLTFIIGGTCFLGAALGFWLVLTRNNFTPRELLGSRPTPAGSLPISVAMSINPVVVTGITLFIQSQMNRHYGLQALGWYGAASTLETTSVMVLMSAMKSFFLPTLGQMESDGEKGRFIAKMQRVLLMLVLPGALLLMTAAPVAVKVLFSRDFGPSAWLAAILSLSIFFQVFTWCYHVYLLHRGEYRTCLMIDTSWSVFRALSVVAVLGLGMPVSGIAWAYVATSAFAAILYAITVRRRIGAAYLNRQNLALGAAILATLAVALWITSLQRLALSVAFALIVAVPWALYGRGMITRHRRSPD